MKISSQMNPGVNDILSVSGSILTINKAEYDVAKVKELPVIDEKTQMMESPENQRVYLESDGSTVIYLKIDFEHSFDFQNRNYELFFDKDLNGDISLEELTAFVTHYNLTEEERIANRRKIRAGYTEEEWKARMDKLGIAH
jgi:hypothetical protein